MNPIDFPQAFRTLGVPAGSVGIVPLRVWTDGQECISCWLPDEKERAAIAAGEPIFLRLLSGSTQYPAALEVGSPFHQPGSLGDEDAEVLKAAGIEP